MKRTIKGVDYDSIEPGDLVTCLFDTSAGAYEFKGHLLDITEDAIILDTGSVMASHLILIKKVNP